MARIYINLPIMLQIAKCKNAKFITASFNPEPSEFLKWNNPPSIFGTIHYHFYGYQDEKLKLISQEREKRRNIYGF